MILVADKFIYLATPHTGSRSTVDVLKNQCKGIDLLPPNQHHARKHNLEALDREKHPEPFYSLIRNPYEFVLRSYWYRNRGNQPSISLDQYIEEYALDAKGNFMGPIIATYMDYVDSYFLFERGLENFFFQVGFPYVRVPTIGMVKAHHTPRLKMEDLTTAQKRSIEQKWPRDVELYKRVLAQPSGRLDG